MAKRVAARVRLRVVAREKVQGGCRKRVERERVAAREMVAARVAVNTVLYICNIGIYMRDKVQGGCSEGGSNYYIILYAGQMAGKMAARVRERVAPRVRERVQSGWHRGRGCSEGGREGGREGGSY